VARILISGLINVETTLRVDGFPIPYDPVRYPFGGIGSTISGVGYNIAKALSKLEHDVRLCALVGQDMEAEFIRQTCQHDGIPNTFILPMVQHTARSVILFDGNGRRQINVDLKDLQETAYPQDAFDQAVDGCQTAILCNINYSRPYLIQARQRGIPIATDVHVLRDLHDAYNADFMRSADILFLSHEGLTGEVSEWANQLRAEYHCPALVIGMGSEGALLTLASGEPQRLPAIQTRPIVNTIGAGDALFSAYVHGTLNGLAPLDALHQAMVYASWKIGENGAAEGLLDASALADLVRQSAK
jgi:ribokinase